MATIITKYSDYVINSVEFFISKIETEFIYRDIRGLSNEAIDIINVTKQHPLVALMQSQLSGEGPKDLLQSGLLPAVSVTPGNSTEDAFTLGQRFQPKVVDDTFINRLKYFLTLTNKEIQYELLITPKQIEQIIGEYNRADQGEIRSQENEWSKNEEINISVWSISPDICQLLKNLIDSTLATIQVGFAGDSSPIRNMKYSINDGLTNFQYGRTLYGTEISLTFLNSYRNYIIYKDGVLSGHDFYGTFTTIDEGNNWEAE